MRVQVLAAVVAFLLFARPAIAYSVITHEVLIDTAWETDLVPVLNSFFGAAAGQRDRKLSRRLAALNSR